MGEAREKRDGREAEAALLTLVRLLAHQAAREALAAETRDGDGDGRQDNGRS
jgi:hypothetical protein